MRRNSSVLTGLCALVALALCTVGGCASSETSGSTAASASSETAQTAKPRRNRLCSGDSLGEKILRSDPSLSASGAPAGGYAAVSE
ncbi:MAG: hypothetical protein AB7G11_09015 [Phycisphaerales bacterium]